MIFRAPIPAYTSNPLAFQKAAFESFKPTATPGKSIFSKSSPPSVPPSEATRESEDLGSTPKRGNSKPLFGGLTSALTQARTPSPFGGATSEEEFED